jgi:hypothetical protein
MPNPFTRVPPVDPSELVCQIGDHLVVIASAITEEGQDVCIGSTYQVIERVGYAWKLSLVQGGGASDLRILNSRMLSLFRVL